MGSTEGNIHSLYNGREYLTGTKVENSIMEPIALNQGNPKMEAHDVHLDPVLFYSDNTHYSIAKASRVLRIKTFGEVAIANNWPVPQEV